MREMQESIIEMNGFNKDLNKSNKGRKPSVLRLLNERTNRD